MVFFSRLGMMALASAYFAASTTAAENQPIPWSGRGQDLTVDTIDKEYLTHILTMRNKTQYAKVSRYVSIEQKARSPAYNGDTGVINIGVDANAIFKEQFDFRRSELVQNVVSNPDGTTFFRASLKKTKAFYNKYAWQCFFTESHIFEIRVDATVTPPKIIYLNNGTWDSKWEANFKTDTWYNFGIGITKHAKKTGSVLKFYTSTGDDDLQYVRDDSVISAYPTMSELHIGLLTLSDDKSQPKMASEQDIISFNGVSVEPKVITSPTARVKSEGSK